MSRAAGQRDLKHSVVTRAERGPRSDEATRTGLSARIQLVTNTKGEEKPMRTLTKKGSIEKSRPIYGYEDWYYNGVCPWDPLKTSIKCKADATGPNCSYDDIICFTP